MDHDDDDDDIYIYILYIYINNPHKDMKIILLMFVFLCFSMSPLHQAALVGEVNIMKLLLDHEAHVDIKDNKGKYIYSGQV